MATKTISIKIDLTTQDIQQAMFDWAVKHGLVKPEDNVTLDLKSVPVAKGYGMDEQTQYQVKAVLNAVRTRT